jgi:hypothetical protein
MNSHVAFTFTMGKLPDNEYAFKNAIFVNPVDFKNYSAHPRSKTFVSVKDFVLELQPLDAI